MDYFEKLSQEDISQAIQEILSSITEKNDSDKEIKLILEERQREFQKRQKDQRELMLNSVTRKPDPLPKNGSLTEAISVATAEEPNYLISDLPPEVLEFILDKLTEPKDLVNCTRASKIFMDVYGSPRTEWTIYEVLPVLYCYIDFTTVLKCRQVCRSWKKAVDKFLALKLVPFPDDDTNLMGLSYKSRKFRSDLISKLEETIQYTKFENINPGISHMVRFMKEMPCNIAESCFIGKRLTLSCLTVDNSNIRFWRCATLLLSKYGRFVLNLEFGLAANQFGFIEVLRSCLHRMPEIRRLTLKSSSISYQCFDRGTTARIAIDFKRKHGVTIFPDLPNLNSLKLRNVPPVTFYVLPEAYWKNLQQLELQDREYDKIYWANNNIIKSWLQKLIDFHITVGKWESLQSLRGIKCPLLEKLTISMETDKINFNDVVTTWNHFGESLRHVKIAWPEDNDQTDKFLFTSTPKPVLPRIEILELINPMESLDFLLFLSSLQCLVIRVTPGSDSSSLFANPKQNDLVRVHGFLNRMYDSNIWWLLPNLIECQMCAKISSSDGDEEDGMTSCGVFRYTRNWYNEI